MMDAKNRMQMRGQFFRFVVVGLLATAAHYALFYPLSKVIPGNLAYTLGYAVSFVLNFYLTAYFTFRSLPSWKKLYGMAGVHLCNYLLHMLLYNLFTGLGIPDKWVLFPIVAIAVPVTFLLARFVFRK